MNDFLACVLSALLLGASAPQVALPPAESQPIIEQVATEPTAEPATEPVAANTAIAPRFAANTADSPITTSVTSLSQYYLGVAKVCIDGVWMYMDPRGNEVKMLGELPVLQGITVPEAQPLVNYKTILRVDDVLLLQTPMLTQCVDLTTGALLFSGQGEINYQTEERDTWNTYLGSGERCMLLYRPNEEKTALLNLDTKQVFVLDCYFSELREGLYRYRENDRYGFKDIYNRVIIPAQYPQSQRMTYFQEGYAMMQKSVENDKLFVVLNRSGQTVYEIELDYQDEWYPYYGGLAQIGRHYFYGYLDTAGNYVVEPQYGTATAFWNQRAVVSLQGIYYLIDPTGVVVETLGTNPLYYAPSESAPTGEPFYSGLRKVWKDYFWGFENEAGEMVIPFSYSAVAWDAEKHDYPCFGEGYACMNLGEKLVVIDVNGDVVFYVN